MGVREGGIVAGEIGVGVEIAHPGRLVASRSCELVRMQECKRFLPQEYRVPRVGRVPTGQVERESRVEPGRGRAGRVLAPGGVRALAGEGFTGLDADELAWRDPDPVRQCRLESRTGRLAPTPGYATGFGSYRDDLDVARSRVA